MLPLIQLSKVKITVKYAHFCFTHETN